MTTTEPIHRFHDGYLTGILLQEGKTVLFLKRDNGDVAELVLSGVEALHADDMRESNIIYSLVVIQNARPEAEVLNRLFPGPHPSAAQQYHDAHSQAMSEKAARVEAGQAVIVSVIPSYGADLVAFCANVSLTWHTGDASAQA